MHVSIKTRLPRSREQVQEDLLSCFDKVIADVLSPYSTSTVKEAALSLPVASFLSEEIEAVLRSVSSSLGQSGDDVQLNTRAAVILKEASEVWVTEILDKNATEFSFTCPRAWSLYSMEVFEAWPDGLVVVNRAGAVAPSGLWA